MILDSVSKVAFFNTFLRRTLFPTGERHSSAAGKRSGQHTPGGGRRGQDPVLAQGHGGGVTRDKVRVK